MLKACNYIKSNTPIALFYSLLIIDNIYNLSISYIINYFDSSLTETLEFSDFSLNEIFFLTVIIAPLFETLIFQFLIIELLYFFKVKNNSIIIISTVLFAISHNYNIVYILAIIFPGLMYATYYLYLKINKKNGFILIFSLHAFSNLISFIIGDVLKWM